MAGIDMLADQRSQLFDGEKIRVSAAVIGKPGLDPLATAAGEIFLVQLIGGGR